jgi:hypothetical protein
MSILSKVAAEERGKWAFSACAEVMLTGQIVKSAAVSLLIDQCNTRTDTHSAKWRLVPRLLGLGLIPGA